MLDPRIKTRLIINAYPGCEYVAWAALLGSMRAHPESKRSMVRTPQGHMFVVKQNVDNYTLRNKPDRCRGWSITQIKDGRDENTN